MTGEDMNKFIADDRRKYLLRNRRLEEISKAIDNGTATVEQRDEFEDVARELGKVLDRLGPGSPGVRDRVVDPEKEKQRWHKMYEDAVKKRAELDAEEGVK